MLDGKVDMAFDFFCIKRYEIELGYYVCQI